MVDHDDLDRDFLGLQAETKRLLEHGEERRDAVDVGGIGAQVIFGPAEFEIVDAVEARLVDHELTQIAGHEVGQVPPQAVKFAGLGSPAVDLSSVKKDDGPFAVVYEAFHYLKPTRAADLTCTVIKALGDKFDMLAYYSDFRIDNPEAGTSSTGPLGGGPAGGAVTGIGANQRNLESYCSQGRFQWQFIQPVYVGSNQMQERRSEEHPA